jgi:hypothetical protein
MFRKWNFNDYLNHILFAVTIFYLFYSFFLHH